MSDEELLDYVREKQTEFWDALRELELQLGVDIDGTQDLADVSIDDLLCDGEDEEEEEEEEEEE